MDSYALRPNGTIHSVSLCRPAVAEILFIDYDAIFPHHTSILILIFPQICIQLIEIERHAMKRPVGTQWIVWVMFPTVSPWADMNRPVRTRTQAAQRIAVVLLPPRRRWMLAYIWRQCGW